jgi:leukotriene-A4 hydrolase
MISVITLIKLANKYYIEAQNSVAEFFNNKLTPSFSFTFKAWNTNVKLVFLNLITEKSQAVNDQLYFLLRDGLGLHSGYNSEIKNLWYQLTLNLKQVDVIPFVEDFLGKIGRMKYIRPIYKAYGLLNKKAAFECFEKNK